MDWTSDPFPQTQPIDSFGSVFLPFGINFVYDISSQTVFWYLEHNPNTPSTAISFGRSYSLVLSFNCGRRYSSLDS